MKRCENCGSEKTVRGFKLTGRYCSPICMNEHMQQKHALKPGIIIGIDVGRDDWVSECVGRVNDDGTITILEINQWKHTINLEPNR